MAAIEGQKYLEKNMPLSWIRSIEKSNDQHGKVRVSVL